MPDSYNKSLTSLLGLYSRQYSHHFPVRFTFSRPCEAKFPPFFIPSSPISRLNPQPLHPLSILDKYYRFADTDTRQCYRYLVILSWIVV